MDSIEKLAALFARFPGIGARQSKRFVYFLLHQNPTYLEELTRGVSELKKLVRQCESCFVFFDSLNEKLCDVCRNPKTDPSILLVVEKDSDYESIKRSHTYGGFYFVLGGLVPIVEKEVEKLIRLRELKKVITERGKNKILKEVILAFALTPQGEHSDTYIHQSLAELKETYDLKISSLGRGLSTGTEIEYSDNETLKNALQNRQ